MGVEPQSEDGAPEKIRAVQFQEHALLAHIVSPEATEMVARIVDLDGEAKREARAAATFPDDSKSQGLQVRGCLRARTWVHL